MTAVIIIPTYNEKGNIEPMIEMLEKDIFPNILDYNMKQFKNLDISEGKKEGLGAAYIRAMTYAIEKMNADIVFEMDSDFFHDPLKIPKFLEKINEGFDFVVGTRYSQGGSIPSDWGF